ncbi:hypothetical protein GCM10009813_28590 [Brevibacterium marinum]
MRQDTIEVFYPLLIFASQASDIPGAPFFFPVLRVSSPARVWESRRNGTDRDDLWVVLDYDHTVTTTARTSLTGLATPYAQAEILSQAAGVYTLVVCLVNDYTVGR